MISSLYMVLWILLIAAFFQTESRISILSIIPTAKVFKSSSRQASDTFNISAPIVFRPKVVFRVPEVTDRVSVCADQPNLKKRSFFTNLKPCFSVPWVTQCDTGGEDTTEIKNTMDSMYTELTTEIDNVRKSLVGAVDQLQRAQNALAQDVQDLTIFVNTMKDQLRTSMNIIDRKARMGILMDTYTSARLSYLSKFTAARIASGTNGYDVSESLYNMYQTLAQQSYNKTLVSTFKTVKISYRKFIQQPFRYPDTMTPSEFSRTPSYWIWMRYNDKPGVTLPDFVAETPYLRWYFSDPQLEFTKNIYTVMFAQSEECVTSYTVTTIPFRVSSSSLPNSEYLTSLPNGCGGQNVRSSCWVYSYTINDVTILVKSPNSTLPGLTSFLEGYITACSQSMYVTEDGYVVSELPEVIGLKSLLYVDVSTEVSIPTVGVQYQYGAIKDTGELSQCFSYLSYSRTIPVVRYYPVDPLHLIPEDLVEFLTDLYVVDNDGPSNTILDESIYRSAIGLKILECSHIESDERIHPPEDSCDVDLRQFVKNADLWRKGFSSATGINSLRDRYDIVYDRPTGIITVSLRVSQSYVVSQVPKALLTCPVWIEVLGAKEGCQVRADSRICYNELCGILIAIPLGFVSLRSVDDDECVSLSCTEHIRVTAIPTTNATYLDTRIFEDKITTDITGLKRAQLTLDNTVAQFSSDVNLTVKLALEDFTKERERIRQMIADIPDNSSFNPTGLIIGIVVVAIVVCITMVCLLFVVSKLGNSGIRIV